MRYRFFSRSDYLIRSLFLNRNRLDRKRGLRTNSSDQPRPGGRAGRGVRESVADPNVLSTERLGSKEDHEALDVDDVITGTRPRPGMGVELSGIAEQG